MNTAFIDLRADHQTNQGHAGFWPSFTDIMTTIVMIFLIALVVLLARNLELVQQLRATMAAEQLASERAFVAGEKNDLLTTALHAAEDRLADLRVQLRQLQVRDQAQLAQIAEQQYQIADLQQARDQFAQEAAALLVLREQLQSEVAQLKVQSRKAQLALQQREVALQAAQVDMQMLDTELQAMRDDLTGAQQRSQVLRAQLDEKTQLLAAQTTEAQAAERRYATLAEDYTHLKTKYDKLVRPARSARGRYRVEVRYRKRAGEYQIAWREGASGQFQVVTQEALDRILTGLDQQHTQGLYIRVVLPDDSELSHTEAWKFTLYLHQRYDYYFKKPSRVD